MSEQYRHCVSILLEFLYLDVAVPHLIAVVLQEDMTFCSIAEVGPILVFAVSHKGIPHLVVAIVLKEFFSIEPVLHMVSFNFDHSCVPAIFIDRLCVGSRYEVIERTQFSVAFHTQLGIGMEFIVKYLEFASYRW